MFRLPCWMRARNTKTEITGAMFLPDPDGNPNRCIGCLDASGEYFPASDSMFFDTNVCGGCGAWDEVCDPVLLREYRSIGMDVSAVPAGHVHHAGKYPLVRLRIRMDQDGGDRVEKAPLKEFCTTGHALELARSYVSWKREDPS